MLDIAATCHALGIGKVIETSAYDLAKAKGAIKEASISTARPWSS